MIIRVLVGILLGVMWFGFMAYAIISTVLHPQDNYAWLLIIFLIPFGVWIYRLVVKGK